MNISREEAAEFLRLKSKADAYTKGRRDIADELYLMGISEIERPPELKHVSHNALYSIAIWIRQLSTPSTT